MEYNREYRNRPTHKQATDFQQRKFMRERIDFSTNSYGIIGHSYAKNP